MSLIQILFLLISTLGLLMALGTVLTRNLVHAALHLIAFFFLVACQFVLLEVEFLAAMQVLVYIGAVSILILFGIMLTRNIQGDETTGGPWPRKLPAAAVALGVLAVLSAAIGEGRGGEGPEGTGWAAVRSRPGGVNPALEGPEAPRAAVISSMPRVIGDELMTRYVIPFEVAGLLLTAALVGAVALARRGAPVEGGPGGLGAVRGAGSSPGVEDGRGPAEAVGATQAASGSETP